MKIFHMKHDPDRLYFKNYERRLDDEEFEEVIVILKRNNCKFVDTIMGPDCDIIKCWVENFKFDIIRTIDGEGTFLYCDNKDGMKVLENIFNDDNNI